MAKWRTGRTEQCARLNVKTSMGFNTMNNGPPGLALQLTTWTRSILC
jgi:hypothetical protein